MEVNKNTQLVIIPLGELQEFLNPIYSKLKIIEKQNWQNKITTYKVLQK